MCLFRCKYIYYHPGITVLVVVLSIICDSLTSDDVHGVFINLKLLYVLKYLLILFFSE